MYNRQRVWLWLSTAVSFIMGFILILNDSGAGWFLIILGFTYLAASTGAGQAWAASNPSLARWGFIRVTSMLVLLFFVVSAVVLLK